MSKKLATFNQKDKTNRAATASEIAARFVPSRKYVQLATKTKSINKFIQTKRKVIKIGNFKHLLAIRRELRKAIKQITNNPVTIKFIHIYKELTKTVIRRTDFITKPIKKKLKPPISLFIRRFNQVVDRLGRKRVKWASFGLIGILIVVGLTLGTMTYIHNLINSSYNLPVNEQALIGSPDTALMKSQLTYNSKTKTYYLDKSGIGKSSSSIPGVPSGDNSITVGSKSKSTFSLVIPANIHQGFTTYDKTSGLSFTLTPEFDAMNGKLVNGHLVYPMGLSSAKDVYTIKANGLQENIVYNSAPAETVKLAYKLTLPNTLQAKMMPGGNIGIYSASSYLFGNISYGSAKDQALVAKARLNAAKTNLVFVLPAPEITDNDGMAPTKVQQQTKFSLKGDILTLTATDLDGIHGPLSIDPSIIDATASAFQLTGNNEGDISFANSEVSEAGLSGGALSGNTNSCGSWCASNGTAGTGANLPIAAYFAAAVAYNGYIYQMGGIVSGSATAVVDYAAITATGALAAPGTCPGGTITGDWCASNGTAGTGANLPAATDQATAVAYNGYVYQIGGATAVVDYAAITATGALAAPGTCPGGTINGDWCASNGTAGTGANLPAATGQATTVAYNGYIYEIGGCATACPTAVVDYAAITATGALAAPGTCPGGTITGDWCASNGTAGTGANLPAATYVASAVVYNGYVYQIGGVTSGATAVVDYAAITATGALAAPGTCAGTITGDWCASTSAANGSLPVGTYGAGSIVYNGYVYEIGGHNSSAGTTVVDYAPIYNGGDIGTWEPTAALTQNTYYAPATTYNGSIYLIGGYISSPTAIVNYAAISSPGDIAPWAATDNLPASTYAAAAVAYNGFVYQIGGLISGSGTAIVDYAAITATGALAAPGTCPGGTITGAWCASNGTAGTGANLPTDTYETAAVAYNGFVYEIGGLTDGGSTSPIVDYAAITATGALAAPGTCPGGTITGDWCASNGTAGTGANLPAATNEATIVTYNGFVYEIGGCATACPTAVVDYAAITATGALAAPGTCPGGTITGDWCASNGTAGTGANLPAATQYASAAFYNGYIYQIGGCTTACPTATNVVDYAAITASGALAAPGTCAGTITGDWCASTSAANGNLSASTYATAVAYNGYIYFMGGYTTVSVNVVDYAAITASGALAAPGTCAGTINGDWCASNGTVNGNLPTPTRLATAVAYNGYIYFMGGYTTVGTGAVDYAVINNGGPATVSTWTESSTTANTGFSLPTATEEAAAVVYNGYIYFMGGYTSAVVPTVDYALLNANGSLGPPSSGTCAAAGGTQETDWCESPTTANTGFSLPTATEEATAVAYNGYIYFMGGFTTGAAPTVDYALLNANGSLGAPAAGTCAAAGGSQNTVWCESSTTANTGFSLPTATEEAAAVVYNGYIYFMGGATGSLVPTVDYVLLNANGSLGPPSSGTCAAAGGTQETDWCESPTTANTGFSLPVAINAASAVAYNGYIYFMGGYTSTAVPTVDYALLNANGSLGPPAAGTCAAAGGSQNTVWCESSTTANTGFSLPAATWSAAVTVYNGYIYLIGGATTFAVSAVYYAPIYNGGSIGPWASTTSLPEVTYYATAVAYNGYIYLLGGNNGNNVPVVNYAAPLSIPRIGFYSILIDMSGSSTKDPTADYLLANGTQTGDPGIGGLGGPGTGGVNINYQFGSNACPTFNSSAALTTSSLVLGTPYSMTSSSNGCSSSSATDFGRWVWVTIKLDDSQTATFPDSSGNHATITGLTLYYHPATNGRLRGGATFSNSSLQSLDAPP